MPKIAFITLGDTGGSITINLRARCEAAAFAFVARLRRRSLTGARMVRALIEVSRGLRESFGRNGGAALVINGAAVSNATAGGPQDPKSLGAFSGLVCNPEADMVSCLTKLPAKMPPQPEETMTTFESLAIRSPWR
jgi:hypothetical protein